MKKLLLLICMVAGVYTANAQSATVGVRVGANISNLSGDLRDEDLFENKVGLHAGAIFNFPIVEDFFSIQPELLYSVKGFKFNETQESPLPVLGGTRTREGKVNYSYIDLPILARVKAGPLYFEAGPQASYLLSVNNKTKTYYNGNLQSSTSDEKSKAGLSEFEIGYAAGIGFASNNGISVGVRYNGSLKDFVEDDMNFDGDVTNARHSVFMITLGLTIPSGN
ncbi:porin family protein [Botryobacter ruber]|uniref:porin family protein n=1 Tax=Botryobacter ruber TaxID=2171629 RepID=UPI000E0A6E9C|nr:porin family protein [Botryobacter ruber]